MVDAMESQLGRELDARLAQHLVLQLVFDLAPMLTGKEKEQNLETRLVYELVPMWLA